METITLENDIPLITVKAESFPAGILEAHRALHSRVPFTGKRRYFGISRPDRAGIITYWAGAEELQTGEAEKFNCEAAVIRKGPYAVIALQDYAQNPSIISETFDKLLKLPNLRPDGYCVEWYFGKDMKCMVPLQP